MIQFHTNLMTGIGSPSTIWELWGLIFEILGGAEFGEDDIVHFESGCITLSNPNYTTLDTFYYTIADAEGKLYTTRLKYDNGRYILRDVVIPNDVELVRIFAKSTNVLQDAPTGKRLPFLNSNYGILFNPTAKTVHIVDQDNNLIYQYSTNQSILTNIGWSFFVGPKGSQINFSRTSNTLNLDLTLVSMTGNIMYNTAWTPSYNSWTHVPTLPGEIFWPSALLGLMTNVGEPKSNTSILPVISGKDGLPIHGIYVSSNPAAAFSTTVEINKIINLNNRQYWQAQGYNPGCILIEITSYDI